jgi:hypothetical protein
MPNPRFTDGPIRWARSLNDARETRTMVSPVAGGYIVVTPMGQGLMHLEVDCMTCRLCYPSRHRPVSSGTPPGSCVASSFGTLPATRWTNFARR